MNYPAQDVACFSSASVERSRGEAVEPERYFDSLHCRSLKVYPTSCGAIVLATFWLMTESNIAPKQGGSEQSVITGEGNLWGDYAALLSLRIGPLNIWVRD